MRHLCVCTQGARLGYNSHRVNIQIDGEIVRSVPIEPLESVELYGNVQATTQLIHELLRRNISVGMYSLGGFYIGNIGNPDCNGRSDIVKAQVIRAMDDVFRLKLAKIIIRAKIHNQKIVLRRSQDAPGQTERDQLRQLDILEKRINGSKDISEIMGIEGNAARIYFSGLGKALNSPYNFYGRNRRPAKDPFNALINYGYAVLQNQVTGKLIMNGANPSIGMLHSSHGNKKALSFDLMEEWRPVIVDSLALHCLSSKKLREDHFEIQEDGGINLTKEGLHIYRRKIIDKYDVSTSYIKCGANMSFNKALNYQADSIVRAIQENDASIYSACRIR